jgi:hypothetical protein
VIDEYVGFRERQQKPRSHLDPHAALDQTRIEDR